MKLTFSAIALGMLLGAPLSQAASGIFGTGVVFTTNGTLTLYESTLLGDGRHAPSGASPVLNTVGFNGLDLGTFNPGLGNTLVLNGAEMLTFKNGTDNITGTRVLYSIDGGSFTALANLGFNQDNVSGAGGDQRWYSDGGATNILSALGNGAHTIAVRYEADFTFSTGSGTHQSGAAGAVGNNSTSPYVASFTIVPEPSVALLGGLAGLFLLRRRR